jgi:glucuronoarabinoxylan endo-1,4-beta-xylanase
MNRISVDVNRTCQEIDGFGVHGAFHQARNLRRYPEADQQRILDVLFSTQNDGAGASIVRNIIGDSGVWGNEKDGPIPSIEPVKGVVNTQGDEDQIFASTAWSPPAWMKTTGDVANGGSLKVECYADFAEYLARYVRLYKQAHGIDIYAVSPSNEPDLRTRYSSCLWSGEQFADFYKNHLSPVFKREGIPAKTFGPETTTFGNAKLEEYSAFLLDQKASSALDILALHGYDCSAFERLSDRYVNGRKIWVSEICEIGSEECKEFDPSIQNGLSVAKRIHDCLTVASVSAFVFFWGMSMYNNNSALVYLNLDDVTYAVAKRAYTFGQYSRFVRPGSIRVEATLDQMNGIYATAFKGPDGKLVAVVINSTFSDCSFSLEFKGAAPSVLTSNTTDESNNLAQGRSYALEGGRAAVTVKAQSVTTFVG